jgi:2-keto-myo-inositol isomerase
MNRRHLLKSSLLTLGGMSVADANAAIAPKPKKKKHNFSFCLNTSTISKQNLGLVGEIKMAAQVGYDGIEIWMRTLDKYVKDGGKLSDIRQLATDLGIRIEDCIGFAAWVVDDDTKRNAALDQIKKEMDMLAQIGCKRIAAPPFGATTEGGLNLYKAAERYAKYWNWAKKWALRRN